MMNRSLLSVLTGRGRLSVRPRPLSSGPVLTANSIGRRIDPVGLRPRARARVHPPSLRFPSLPFPSEPRGGVPPGAAPTRGEAAPAKSNKQRMAIFLWDWESSGELCIGGIMGGAFSSLNRKISRFFLLHSFLVVYYTIWGHSKTPTHFDDLSANIAR